MIEVPARFRSAADRAARTPVHVVWEITLACNLKCSHCGSRAGKPRAQELSTEQCLRVVEALASLGTRQITLIGGEAYLRKDWLEIISAISGHGIRCSLQTGARHLTRERLEAARVAGLSGLGVSVDGPEAIHDALRGVRGSYRHAVHALREAHELGLGTSVNTQICTANEHLLEETYDVVKSTGATHWQTQLTVAMGNAVDNDSLILQPFHLLEIMPALAELYLVGQEEGILLIPGNNVGYFGPYEHLWRGHSDECPHWSGCAAGETAIGLEADGTLKGCPSLESRIFGEGNVLDTDVAGLWSRVQPVFERRDPQQTSRLVGFCRTCFYSDICRAGCTWTGHSLLGEVGDNPFCHYRALKLEELGYHEVIEKAAEASSASFAIGRFTVQLHSIDDAAPASGAAPRDNTNGIRPRAHGHLVACAVCNCFHSPAEITCPFCGADVAEANHTARAAATRASKAMEFLESRLKPDA